MSHLRVPLRQRSEASSFLVRSPNPEMRSPHNNENNNTSHSSIYPFYPSPSPYQAHSIQPPLDLISYTSATTPTETFTPVTGAGVFVTPNTLRAALPTPPWTDSSNPVLTAETGGWIRLREQRNGTIHHQRQLRGGGEVTCLCWGPCKGRTFLAGRSNGVLTLARTPLGGDGKGWEEMADGILHVSRIVALERLTQQEEEEEEEERGEGGEVLSLDVNGLLALWWVADGTRGALQLCCKGTWTLCHPPGCCLTVGTSNLLPGAVCLPGGLQQTWETNPSPPLGPWDVTLLYKTSPSTPEENSTQHDGKGLGWRTHVTYLGSDSAVLSLTLAPRGDGNGAATLWAGTANGALCVWDAWRGGRPLRVVSCVTPSRSPVHYVTCAVGLEPRHVWVCTRGGSVALWDARRLTMVCELPIGYPRPNHNKNNNNNNNKANAKGHIKRGGGGGRGVEENAPDMLEEEWGKGHCTLFVAPIEMVQTVRFWSAATDGTVRTWLCHTSLTETPSTTHGHQPTSPNTPREEIRDGVVMDKASVGAFICAKANLFRRETTSLRETVTRLTDEVNALHARNRILAEALRQAIERLESDKENEAVSFVQEKVKPHPHSMDAQQQTNMDDHEQRASLEMVMRQMEEKHAQEMEAERAMRHNCGDRLTHMQSVLNTLRQRLGETHNSRDALLCENESLHMQLLDHTSPWHQLETERTQKEGEKEEKEGKEEEKKEEEEEELQRRQRLMRSHSPELEQMTACEGYHFRTLRVLRMQLANSQAESNARARQWQQERTKRLAAEAIPASTTMHTTPAPTQQEALAHAWEEVRRTQTTLQEEAMVQREDRQWLMEREATLLEQAERLCALEEELRGRERGIMEWQRQQRGEREA